MKIRLPIMIMAFAIFLPVCARAQDIPANLRLSQYDAELLQLDWEIKTLNLINGLYLSEDQMDDMLAVLEDLQNLNEEFYPRMEEARENARAAYAALRDDLLDDDLVDPDTERRAGGAKHEMEQLIIDYSRRLAQLESGMLAVLDDKQVAITEEFVPCIVPPASDNDARIGATAGGNPQIENMLERLREMPDAQVYTMLPDFIARHINQYEIKHGDMTQQEKDAEFDRLYDLAMEVRSMSDLEFQDRKSELAAEILPQALRNKKDKKNRKNKDKPNQQKTKYELSLAGSFLLNENLIPMIEEKLGRGGGE